MRSTSFCRKDRVKLHYEDPGLNPLSDGKRREIERPHRFRVSCCLIKRLGLCSLTFRLVLGLASGSSFLGLRSSFCRHSSRGTSPYRPYKGVAPGGGGLTEAFKVVFCSKKVMFGCKSHFFKKEKL